MYVLCVCMCLLCVLLCVCVCARARAHTYTYNLLLFVSLFHNFFIIFNTTWTQVRRSTAGAQLRSRQLLSAITQPGEPAAPFHKLQCCLPHLHAVFYSSQPTLKLTRSAAARAFVRTFAMIVQSRAAKQGYVRYSAQMLHANISEKLLASLSHHL
jgi:hypothetical protein